MNRQNAGFTLVELLVAMSLFAMISVASLALLRSSIDTQAALAGRMDRTAGIERIRALIADALLTAQPQALRPSGQVAAPAFTGAADRISFISAAPGPDGAPVMTRLTMSASGNQLTLARGGTGADSPALLITNLTTARFRYRNASGSWEPVWSPVRADELPRAAELTLQQEGGPEILMRFIVAPDWPAPEPVPS